MITTAQYFSSVPDTSDVPTTHVANAEGLLDKVNTLLSVFVNDNQDFVVRMNSGYRTVAHNATVLGAAPNSKHTTGQAIDIGDSHARTLALWCLSNTGLLQTLGLYCEDMRATPTWVHFQSTPPVSRARFFIPTTDWAVKLAGKPLTEGGLHG